MTDYLSTTDLDDLARIQEVREKVDEAQKKWDEGTKNKSATLDGLLAHFNKLHGPTVGSINIGRSAGIMILSRGLPDYGFWFDIHPGERNFDQRGIRVNLDLGPLEFFFPLVKVTDPKATLEPLAKKCEEGGVSTVFYNGPACEIEFKNSAGADCKVSFKPVDACLEAFSDSFGKKQIVEGLKFIDWPKSTLGNQKLPSVS